MFLQRVASIAVVLFALVPSSSDAISLRRRLGATYSADSDDWRQAMLTAVNTQRANSGLSALCMNSKLATAAQGHSNDMAANNYMDHTGSDGSTMAERVTDAGYDWNYVAENVAAGQVDVDAVMTSWMNSEGHRANILSSDITMFGCGYAYSDSSEYGHYWTQDFGAGPAESCDSSTTDSTTGTKTDEIAGEASDAVDNSSAYTPETTAPAATTAAPATEAPATEAPAPVTEAPAPVTEAPAPVTEAPVTDAPATEAPVTEAPVTEAPVTEAPASGGCRVRRH